MRIKTSELTGAALDWAVAKIEGLQWASWNRDGWTNDWAQGGPIIEREGITIWAFDDVTWRAQLDTATDPLEAPTPLIAAMRCYVASKLGDEVEVPEELK